MQIHIKYFARYRELLACDTEVLDWSTSAEEEVEKTEVTVSDIAQRLSERGEAWQKVFGSCSDLDLEPWVGKNLLCSINHELCHLNSKVSDADELAFFPPVTGG